MSKFQHVIEHAERHCQQNGSRLTVKRKRVLLSLLISEKAMSAYDLIDFCNAEFGESMPAMSVYRILEFLEQQQLVHKLNLANKYVACSHISCSHSHEVSQFVICGQCQAVKEIAIKKATLNQLKKNIEDAGFQLVSPQLEMNCICAACLLAA